VLLNYVTNRLLMPFFLLQGMSGEDASGIPLLSSGFAILPDARPRSDAAGESSSSSGGPLGTISPGCVTTIVFQILVSSLPSSRVNAELMGFTMG